MPCRYKALQILCKTENIKPLFSEQRKKSIKRLVYRYILNETFLYILDTTHSYLLNYSHINWIKFDATSAEILYS